MLKKLVVLITAALTFVGLVTMAEAGGRWHGSGSAYSHGYYGPRPVYGYGYGYRHFRLVYGYLYGYRPYYGYGYRRHRGKGGAIAAGLGGGLIGGALPAQAAEPAPIYNAPVYPGYQGYNEYRSYGD